MGKSKFAIPDYDGPGLYEIRNLSNGKIYIGSTSRVNKRAIQHSRALDSNKHHCKALQADFNNGDNLALTIIKKIHTDLEQELQFQESLEVNKRRRAGIKLYNGIGGFRTYTDENLMIRHLANLWCKEKYGKSLSQFLSGNIVEREMKYQILKNPDKEIEIREHYRGAIKYETAKLFYKSQYNIDYDDFLEIPKDKRLNLNELRKKRMERDAATPSTNE